METTIAKLIVEVKHHSVTVDEVSQSQVLLDEIGLDSLEIIELLLHIERQFGVHVDFDNFTTEHLRSVDTLAEYVRQTLNQRGRIISAS